MTLVQNPLETLDYVTGTAISSPAANTAILTTDVVNATANPADQQPAGIDQASPQVVRPVIVEANINITAGTGATAVVVSCYQGATVGGTQVQTSRTHTLAAAASGQLHFKFRDTSGVPYGAAGTAYTIGIAETGASAAGTVNYIDIEVRQ
jgi:hypothetical protein